MLVNGASLSEPHSLVAHRAQAQCIMVRSLYVRTRNFSYSDLNPTGFSPRTGYFEDFQSLYSDLQYILRAFRLSPADNFSCDMRWNIFFMPNNKWKLEWSVLFTVVSIIKPIAILLYSVSEWVADQILMQSPISIRFGLNIL
jgi:hypothetical protein